MPRIEFNNPFSAPGRWWKGNLHTHTNVSDGELTPRAAAEAYHARGYDFLAITDHLVIATPFDGPEDLLLVPGAEYHTLAGDPVRAWHFVSLGTKRPVSGAMGPVEDLRENVRAGSEYWFLAHPYWSNLAEDDLSDVPGCPAVEVFNGVCERAIARGYAQAAWDRALVSPLRMDALAVDDTHAACEVGRGWIMLRAERLDLDALYEALHKGFWYSTNGPAIHDVRVAGSVVSVRTSSARSIAFVARSPDGKRFAAREGFALDAAEYELKGTEIYLRVEVEDAEGRRAFTNPLYVTRDGGASPAPTGAFGVPGGAP